MKAFRNHRGLLAALDRANVDTDQIIPKQFLKKITRTGFGEDLFFDWRYLADGKLNPSFELNQERFKGASILVTRHNFGCGSSCEHAVWAIEQCGFQVVIAPSADQGGHAVPAFADIFRNNSLKNGLLTIELKSAEVDEIFEAVHKNIGLEAEVDLESQTVSILLNPGPCYHFEIDPAVKNRLIHGLDDIGLTLQYESAIGIFEKQHDAQFYQ